MLQRLPTPYRPEASVVAHLLGRLGDSLDASAWQQICQAARPWVQAVRDHPAPFWAMETLLKEYPISSAEGLALMRLAEALLRVPDVPTAITLTADQLSRANFDGASDSSLSRLSSAAIALSKHFLPQPGQSPGIVANLGANMVVRASLHAVQLLGRQFVLGQTIADAQRVAQQSADKTPGRLAYSYDMLGEGARTMGDAKRYLAAYREAILAIASKTLERASSAKGDDVRLNDGISVKLSALHPRYEFTQRERVLAELVPTVFELCQLAAAANINLTIDAEEVDRLELSLDVFEALLVKIAAHCPGWGGFGLALQAYQTRALELVEHVAELAIKHQVKLMCRLVKGAYWDAEIKRAQELGLAHYPVFTHKQHTDVSYLACAQALLKHSDVIFPQFATHNAVTIAAIKHLAAQTDAAFELQRLHGMGEGVYREVLKQPGVRCRVYAPVGAYRDLLAYLVRRLLENGANSSFVHQLASDEVSMDELLASPLVLHPVPSLALPAQLLGKRLNSSGVDLADPSMRAPFDAAFSDAAFSKVSLAAVQPFDHLQAPLAFALAHTGFITWAACTPTVRAAVLRKAAEAMQMQMPELSSLLVKEAFKTWNDAISEVREAIDFLRYYADESERIMAPIHLPGPTGETNTLRLKARGVWVCISPWNFPLAIFTGQVAAALATGNAVLAKPAEQTPAIAQAVLEILRKAGLPAEALQLCQGPGETVGASLVALPDIAGVVFTGSTPVARLINRALAGRDGPMIPFIAETGGINAMVVDSSALPEQVCDAVIQSSFRSAGQRCSALRLLCVHEAIADSLIEMIQGAMRELVTGDSANLSTDVARVIDAQARDTIEAHLGKLGVELERGRGDQDCLIRPYLIEVPSIEVVQAEIFGPVLQVLRYSGDPLRVIEQVNQLGYGLTLGIQTRIDARAQAMAEAAQVGNVYINRNMIGAVVGVQPFGGEGLSGTGPKAGGPHYLVRFCAEQTITVNTTAAGGNAALLAGAEATANWSKSP